MIHNVDQIVDTEPRIFESYLDFSEWIGNSKSFISPPILFALDGDNIFNRNWTIIDRFESGLIQYTRKR